MSDNIDLADDIDRLKKRLFIAFRHRLGYAYTNPRLRLPTHVQGELPPCDILEFYFQSNVMNPADQRFINFEI